MSDGSSLDPICIASNPAVSGIGVRVATYTQCFLNFVPALLALWRGTGATAQEFEALEANSFTMISTGYAMVMATIIQAQAQAASTIHLAQAIDFTLTNFQAVIMLNLSGMCSLGIFTYLLILAFCQHDKRDYHMAIWHYCLRLFTLRGLFSVPFLGSLQMSLLSGIGILLWNNLPAFGKSPQCSLKASVFMVGQELPLVSSSLRIWSILMYSLFSIPFFNIFGPLYVLLKTFAAIERHRSGSHDQQHRSRKPLRRRIAVIGLMILFFASVVLLVDTELEIGKNPPPFLAQDNDSWQFGQVLPVVLAAISLVQTIKVVFQHILMYHPGEKDLPRRVRRFLELNVGRRWEVELPPAYSSNDPLEEPMEPLPDVEK